MSASTPLRIRLVSLAGVLLAAGYPALANCPLVGWGTVINGLTNHFVSCGASPTTFIWQHGRGVQGVIGALNAANQGNTPAGHDSGNRSGILDSTFCDAGAPGEYFACGDFGNEGWDGCDFNITEGYSTCSDSIYGNDYLPLDYVIAGIDPASPNVARVAAVSVDFNELLFGYLTDAAGAPSVDGDPCGTGDPLSGNPNNLECTAIPVPVITAGGAAAGGTSLTLAIGSTAGIPMLDDCLVAETRALNCPRNFYAGRVLMYKRGSCADGVAGFDRRVYVYPPNPASGTLQVMPNWTPFSVEDANLNGILDTGEDGTHGGTVNGVLDPFVVPGTDATSATIFIPAVAGATDCLYLAMGIGLDDNRLSINPPGNTIFGEMVISPMVSVNHSPVIINPTIAGDALASLSATKAQGKLTVAWTMQAEFTTAGFNVIALKKGAETRLNASLIPAQQGSTGVGASYTASFDSGQLKGATQVLLELVKLDATTQRFGPVFF